MHPVSLALTVSLAACGWGDQGGHAVIRRQALAWLPAWQVALLGEAGPRLAADYLALQDQHASGQRPDLDPYCTVPGGPISLHDPCPPARAGAAFGSYLQRVRDAIQAGETDEAARYLGVLCHWLEDPSSPSMHATEGFIDEARLRELIPPPSEKRRWHYLYGAYGIADDVRYDLPEATHIPVLLGRTIAEASLHLQRRQRLQARLARQAIVPLVMSEMHEDGTQAARLRGELLMAAAKTSADAIFTALCLATDRLEGDTVHLDAVPLTDFVDDYRGGRTSAPYMWVPFLEDASFDAGRNVVPLAVPGANGPREFARGIGMGAPFALSRSFGPAGVLRRLTASVGLHPASAPDTAAVFVVRAGEQELARIGPITAGEPGRELIAELPTEGDAVTLTLATELPEGAEGAGCLAVWGEPTLRP